MNENLNLVDILKDCPKGTKLYSPIVGEVEFNGIDINSRHPIGIRCKCGVDNFTKDGRLFWNCDGEYEFDEWLGRYYPYGIKCIYRDKILDNNGGKK